MYNILQSYVNLMNANTETFFRFANARDVTELANGSAIKSVQVLQENVSNVYADLTKTTIDLYLRFANEYTQDVYEIMSKGEEFVSRQVEEGQRRFAQIASGVEAESLKSAGDEVGSEADQQPRRTRQQRSK